MKMIMVDDLYVLSLATRQFEELSVTVEERLHQAGIRVVPKFLRKNTEGLAKKIANLEAEPSWQRDRHIHYTRLAVVKCAVNLDATAISLPSAGELCERGKALLLKIMNGLEGLKIHGPKKRAPKPRAKTTRWPRPKTPRWLN
jgi:hypothetical protein